MAQTKTVTDWRVLVRTGAETANKTRLSYVLGEQVNIKKVSDFDDKLDFISYMFELFIASEMCDKEVKELNDIDIARTKRDLKGKDVELVWL